MAYFLVYVVWGSTYFFIGVALQGLPPFLLGALRFSAAGLLLLAVCALRGERVLRAGLVTTGDGLNNTEPAPTMARQGTLPAGIWRCPEGAPAKNDWDGAQTHYGMNGETFREYRKTHFTKRHSSLAMMADTINSGVAFFNLNTANEGTDSSSSRIRYNHHNSANFLMLDGHVENFGLLRVPTRVVRYWEY